MARAVNIFESISKELTEANRADIEAQKALWREKSLARREGRRPHPKYARAWIAAGDRVHQLKIEAGLHCPRPSRNEFFYDPNLAFSPAGPGAPSANAVSSTSLKPQAVSDFRRHP